MRVCIRVFGIVQGVGFRPTVKRHADVCRIEGSVSNKGLMWKSLHRAVKNV